VHIRGHFHARSVASTIAAAGLAFASVGCGDDDDSASTTEPTASLTSAAITVNDLEVTDCDTEGASDIVLEATSGGFLLQVDAPGGTGSIMYTGGELENEEIQGSVDSVTVEEDGSFTVEGSWQGGEAYTLTGVTGSCTSL
jgi:hypothetical protein